jgi:hypothetical protein
MENDIYNEGNTINKIIKDKQNNLLPKLILKKELILKKIDYENLKDNTFGNQSTARSILPKSLLQNSEIKNQLVRKTTMPFSEENSFRSFTRRDNFGNEIKKGGKHKISFADEIKVAETLMENKNNKKMSKNNKYKKHYSSKCLEGENLSISGFQRRAITPKNSRALLKKCICNIYKNNKKIIEDFLVNVIKIESTKKETKLNTYSIKNRIIPEEEQVCCSCYCSIW